MVLRVPSIHQQVEELTLFLSRDFWEVFHIC
jgi:hypothetical protein